MSNAANDPRWVWCGEHEPHGRHEWLRGARRMDCPGIWPHGRHPDAADQNAAYPRGMVDAAILALEAARPDTKEGGAVRYQVDDALDRLYRYREIETGEKHPYREAAE